MRNTSSGAPSYLEVHSARVRPALDPGRPQRSSPEHQAGFLWAARRSRVGAGAGSRMQDSILCVGVTPWVSDECPLPAFLAPSHHQVVTSQTLLVLTVQVTTPAPASFPWILPLDKTLLFRPCLPQFLCQPLPPKAAPSCPPKLAPHQLLLPDCCPSFSPTPPATSKTHSLPASPVFPQTLSCSL